MPEIRVLLVPRQGDGIELSDEPVRIAPEPVVLSVNGHRNRSIWVDGQHRRLSRGATGVLALDYSRSTGYHRVEIEDQTFWFATEDGKLRLDGLTQMLAHLRDLGTGWTGQVLFSDGSGFQDPHVLYGWFDAHADEALRAIEKVLLSPRTEEITHRVLSRRGGSSILAVPTIRLLRSDPRRYTVEQEGGLIAVGARTFNPTRVVSRRRQHTIDTVPNRRTVQLLTLMRQLLADLLRSQLPAVPKARCRVWREHVGRLAAQPLAVQLATRSTVLVAPRQGVEFTDRSYGQVFHLAKSVGAFGWRASAAPTRRYSYIQSADRIYQVYVAHRVADVLNLQPTVGTFGTKPLAFSGPDYDLYYDCQPPADVLASWRAQTSLPDKSQPDLLLHEKATGKVAVLDAKYRLGPDGLASEDSRKEVAAYQSYYGLSSVAILYPGVGQSVAVLDGHGMSIVEIPVYGSGDGLDEAIAEVLSRVQTPPYR